MAKIKKTSSKREKANQNPRRNSRTKENFKESPEFKSNSSYKDQGFSHQLLKIAQKISSLNFSYNLKIPLSLVLSTFKQLALNEIEASLFSIFLEKFCLKDLSLTLPEQVLFSGLLAKSKLSSSESIQVTKSKLFIQNPKFCQNFSSFEQKNSSLALADALEINERYSSFIHCENNDMPVELEYNLLVDEILKTSVPYNKEVKAEVETNPKNQQEKQGRRKKTIKNRKNDKHVTTPQYPIRRPSANNTTFQLFPADSSLFFPPCSMERAESFSSDYLNLSRGTSANDHLKKIPGLEVISSRRSSDSHARGFFLKD